MDHVALLIFHDLPHCTLSASGAFTLGSHTFLDSFV